MAITRLCNIDACGKKHFAAGFCGMHYARNRNHGSPLGGGAFREKRGERCAINGCDGSVYGRGMCHLHYGRNRRNGDPLIVGRTPKDTLIKWLEAHKDHQGDTCLVWPFYIDKSGYGTAHFSGKGTTASRVMCSLVHGEPPSRLHDAAHSCGKGNEGCVHPAHLRWATRVENAADKLIHGTAPRGERSGNAKLTQADVMLIRRIGKSQRQKVVAAKFGISDRTVGDVLRRKSWSWLL